MSIKPICFIKAVIVVVYKYEKDCWETGVPLIETRATVLKGFFGISRSLTVAPLILYSKE